MAPYLQRFCTVHYSMRSTQAQRDQAERKMDFGFLGILRLFRKNFSFSLSRDPCSTGAPPQLFRPPYTRTPCLPPEKAPAPEPRIAKMATRRRPACGAALIPCNEPRPRTATAGPYRSTPTPSRKRSELKLNMCNRRFSSCKMPCAKCRSKRLLGESKKIAAENRRAAGQRHDHVCQRAERPEDHV